MTAIPELEQNLRFITPLETINRAVDRPSHPPRRSLFRMKPVLRPVLAAAIIALIAQACTPRLGSTADVEATLRPGITLPADCPPPQICETPTEAETIENENQQSALILRELLGIYPTTSQAELANIIWEKQQNTDWLFRVLSNGLPITTPDDPTDIIQFTNSAGQTISYGLDSRGEHWIGLSYSPQEVFVPQYSEIDYIQFDAQSNFGTVPMRSFSHGSNSIYLYAPEEMLVKLSNLWTTSDLTNFLDDYFGDPDSGIQKRLHLVFAPATQKIQLGLEQPFNLESDVNFAAVLSQDAQSLEVVVNIPGIHTDSLVQKLPLKDNLGGSLANERFGFYAVGYPGQKSDNSVPFFEAVSTMAEWVFLFDQEMRPVLMGGDSFSNFLDPLAEFLNRTVPLEKPQIAPSSFASPRYPQF